MFRKNVAVSQTSLLGGKDIKALKASIRTSCPRITDAQLLELISSKARVTLTKLSNRALVYGLEGGDPLFFDPSGHGDRLYPTVYALAKVPEALHKLYTYSQVSDKVLGGADLFLQGLLSPPGQGMPDFLAGSARALCVPGNPLPFAVGTMAVSRIEAERAGMKGRGLTILHTYNDLLWQLGTGAAPNAGFTAARILPCDDGNQEEGETAGAAAPDSDTAAEEVEMGSNAPSSAPGPEAPTTPDLGALSVAEPVETSASSSASLDEILEQAVLGGLHSLRGRVTFDLKQSKYKKLSKLLDRFAKDKVLTQKVVRKQDTISGVDRNHAQYLGWSAVAEKDRLYEAEEVAAGLREYVQQQGLGGAGGSIRLDAKLLSTLFGKKEEFAVGSAIPERALLTKLKDKLQLHHRLLRQTPQGPVVVVRKGTPPPIAIGTAKKRGHPVTTISHVEAFGFTADEMAKDFQKQFSSSCSVASLPGKQEHDMEIIMQGDLVPKVLDFLTTKLGIPVEYIDCKGSRSSK